MDNYFSYPYHFCERELNENQNRLIRQYLLTDMALHKVTDDEITLIQNKFNNKPRKHLVYKTPNKVYDAMCLVAQLSGVGRMTEIRICFICQNG